MRKKMSCFVLVGAAMASASAMACSLEAPDSQVIKQMMAKEIAYRLGIQAQQIPLRQITEPIVHAPLGLGADCSGLGAYHHSSGFRLAIAVSSMSAPAQSSVVKNSATAQQPAGPEVKEQGQRVCNYEGMAVVLGYDYASPVAVNFMRQCN